MRGAVCILLLAAALSGCSVNSFGPGFAVRQDVHELPGARIVTIHARGLHLYTHEGIGAHLGSSYRQFFYPLLDADAALCLAAVLGSAGTAAEPRAAAPARYATQPVVSRIRQSGLGLGYDAHALSLRLGLRSTLYTRLDPDSDTVLWYQQHATTQLPQVCSTSNTPDTSTTTRGKPE